MGLSEAELTSAKPHEAPVSAEGARDLLDVLSEELKQLRPGVVFDSSSLGALYQSIHRLEQPRTALCLSGGGLRSSSFAMGIMQGLARHRLLFQFDYLSMVGGGAHIGSWLSASRYYASTDQDVVHSFVGSGAASQDAFPNSGNNFLAPPGRAIPAGIWARVQNLLLTWMILLPLLFAVVLVPICVAEFIGWSPLWVSPGPQLCLALAAALLVWALARWLASGPGADGHAIDLGRFLWQIAMPQYLAAILLAAVALHPLFGGRPGLASGAVAGAFVYFIAWWIAFAFLRRPAAFRRVATPNGEKDQVPALQLLLSWVVSGAVAGAVLAGGYELWLGMRGAEDYADWIGSWWARSTLVVASVGWALIALLLGDVLYVGLARYARDGAAEREWRARSSGWIVAGTVVWLVLSGIVEFGSRALDSVWHFGFVLAGGTVSGLIALLMGGSAKSAATTARQAFERRPVTVTISIATLIFLPLLAILLADGARHALDAIERSLSPDDYRYFLQPGLRLLVTAIACVACFLFALAASWYININRVSLTALYRDHLIRMFLRPARTQWLGADRVTGLHREGDLRMLELWPRTSSTKRRCLFPVINTRLNVVVTADLGRQERDADSFIITPLASGNERVKFRSTNHYGDTGGGITLGTAIAISGAAASPNQGYNSSPLVSALMTLGNVRLGWWLGNPRYDTTAGREALPLGVVPIINQMLGLSDAYARYVYLSDGGHFENLGIYEMIRRRCRYIVVSDADCDPDYRLEDLGNAIRKVRVDLGVDIRFRSIQMVARQPEPTDGVYCAIADIFYPEPEATPWQLLYIKPGYHGTEPADVRAYAASHPAFPHESGVEQWVSESQIEAYRVLGSFITECICAGGLLDAAAAELTFAQLLTRAAAYLEAYVSVARPVEIPTRAPEPARAGQAAIVQVRRGARQPESEMSELRPLKVFISYSHEDERMRMRLGQHLAPMIDKKLIEIWHDREIEAGANWESDIDRAIEEADIILLLVSAAFLASRYCKHELLRAIERRGEGKSLPIPIILRSCDWTEVFNQPGYKAQAVPRDNRPISGGGWRNQDEAYTNVATELRRTIEARFARTKLL